MKILCFGGSLNGEVADYVSNECCRFAHPVRTEDGSMRWESYEKVDFFFHPSWGSDLPDVIHFWMLDGYPAYRMMDAASFVFFLCLLCRGYR